MWSAAGAVRDRVLGAGVRSGHVSLSLWVLLAVNPKRTSPVDRRRAVCFLSFFGDTIEALFSRGLFMERQGLR